MSKLWFIVIGCLLVVSLASLMPRQVLAASDTNITVQTVPGQTVGQKLGARAKASWPWYVTRASGLVAATALTIMILSGIGQVTGYTFKFLDPLTAWASHRALGIAFGVAVLIHVLSLLFDHFVTFNLLDILVPWLSHYRPVTLWGVHLGSLYVAFGVLAFYLLAIVIITSLLWVEKKPYIWKWIHLLSYIIVLLVFVHALYIGTDMAHGLIRWLWIGLGVCIVLATVHRVWRLRNV